MPVSVPVALTIGLIILIAIGAIIAFRWFHRYRYTDAWRKGEFRGTAFGMLMWFGGIFGHRVPPPPQAKVEFASGRSIAEDSGRPPLPHDTPDDKQ